MRYVMKSDVKETENYVFLTVFCTYGETEISFSRDEVKETSNGLQYIFNKKDIEERALIAAFRANKGNVRGVKGVRNLDLF